MRKKGTEIEGEADMPGQIKKEILK